MERIKKMILFLLIGEHGGRSCAENVVLVVG